MFLRLTSLLLLAVTAPMAALASNKYPIVLVNGLLGWGRDEIIGLPYWGGVQGDLQEQLKSQGYTVYTAGVGPFSSNWDRACELYAIIKGGTVDYGYNNSLTYGHDRYGRTYEGLYPEWGTTNEDGEINKIHLIGHSMGGTTIRMLAQMLASGSTGSPVYEDPASSTLFAGGHDWVHSITTVASPNQGTQLVDGLTEVASSVMGLLPDTLTLLGFNVSDPSIAYDVKLDQWGFEARGEDELLADYIIRAFSSSAFLTADSCLVSLSTAGAAYENTWVTTLPNVYYFSYAARTTTAGVDTNGLAIETANEYTTIETLQFTANFTGSRFAVNEGLTDAWLPNDGAVPVISQIQDSTGTSQEWTGEATKGKWSFLGTFQGVDHLGMMGITLHPEIIDLYAAHAAMLSSLETVDSSSGSAATTEAATALQSAIDSFAQVTSAVQSLADVETLCASPANNLITSWCSYLLSSSSSTDTRYLRV